MHCAGMAKRSIPDELNRLKDHAKLSLPKIAERAGYKTVSGIQRFFEAGYPRQHLRYDIATKLADAFEGRGDPPIQREQVMVLAGVTAAPQSLRADNRLMYAGIAEAGTFRAADLVNQEQARVVDYDRDSRFPKAEQYAWEVQGDSMDKADIPPGFMVRGVRYADYQDLYGEPRDGDLVVVKRTRYDGAEIEWTVKRVHYFPDHMKLVPESSNPTHQPFVVPYDPDPAQRETVEIEAIVTAVFRTFALPSPIRRARVSR